MLIIAVCDDGTYGPTCSGRCGFCQDGAACHKETGTCPAGCQGGWKGDLCIQSKSNVFLN
ncbi:hypothetical protein DPMN_159602 [Dreissena polymorpha]|uniref:Uncharacterized protein n=1 Tax=Dreissena polymorpha TaxID=45954 RepID=A0A9D4IPB1_DREPO|nr:hypothetical protein DPMN_159602 [Dreissena polymorpha]